MSRGLPQRSQQLLWGGRGWAHGSSLPPRRHLEARSFYTYYLRTLSGVTRGSYRLNVTASAPNETRAAQPRQADRSEPFLGILGWQREGWEELTCPWADRGLGPCPFEPPKLDSGGAKRSADGRRVVPPAPRCTWPTWSPRCTTRCGWRPAGRPRCREPSWPPSSATWPRWPR